MKVPNMFQSVVQLLRKELSLNDILLGVISFIIFTFSSSRHSINYVDGLLTQRSYITITLINIVIAILLSVRKIWPEETAIIFLIICTIHILFGPAIVFADFFGFVLLVNVIARGNTEHTKTFVTAAYITTVLSCVAISWNVVMGSIFGSNHSKSSYTCSVRNINSSNIKDCVSNILDFSIPSVVFAIIITTITVIIGYWQRTHVHTIQLLQEHNNAIRTYRRKAQHIAVTAERARIARDMHDIVAHTLSIIIVQADGGRYAASQNILLAKKTMHIIKNEAERAVHDMRRMLEALNDSSSQTIDWDHVPLLIEKARVASPNNTFWHTVSGINSQNKLNKDAQIVAYRVIQEALSNIRKHAGDGVKVNIHEQWNNQGLTLKIINEINKTGAKQEHDSNLKSTHGYGLIGMRERIEHLQGKLDYEEKNGKFSIVAFIPYSYEDTSSSMTDALTFKSIQGNTINNVKSNASGIKTAQNYESQTGSTNKIEQLSHWFEQHWLVGDIIYATPWTIIMFFVPTYDFILGSNMTYNYSTSLSLQMLYKIFTLTTMIPFMFRRKAPITCAVIAAIFSAIQLIFLPNILFANLFIPSIIYSAVLYGKKRTWQWVSAIVLVECAIFAVKIGIASRNIPQDVNKIQPFTSNLNTFNFYDIMQIASVGLVFGFIVALICFTVIAFAYYRRNDDNNLLLLKARRTELEKEQKQLEILAANAERQRLSTNIQQKVTVTLNKVIDAANDGINMLNKYEKENNNVENQEYTKLEQTQEQSETISRAFKNIGDEGRSALKYMRKLLGILRETSSSVNTEHNNPNTAPITRRPAPSLEEQIQHNFVNNKN